MTVSPPEVKVYFWLTANWCECSHPERFSRERLFMGEPGEPPYLLFPETFCVRLCYIFVGFLSYDFAMETRRPRKCPWANSKKRKKRKTQETRKAGQRKHVVASLHQTKVHIIGNGRKNLPITEERGLLNVWTDFNRNSDSESPDDLIPNNTLRAQTTRKRTASVITAIRWNTL